MCSIPGSPTPGSEVSVVITRVNLQPKSGLVELWAKIHDEWKLYHQMREEIKIHKQKFGESEGNPGDRCLVQIKETWHRARIVSICDQNYNVFLIDQGIPHITTSSTLAWGQSDTFLLPPEIELCVLANVMAPENNWSERATRFLKSLPGSGKSYNGLVQEVLNLPDKIILIDIPAVSKHMCMVGFAKKIPMVQFKGLVLSSSLKGESSEIHPIKQDQHLNDAGCKLEKFDQYFYPELLTDVCESIAVTEVTDPLHIFCKLSIFSKQLTTVSEQMQQYYGGNSTFGKGQPQACGAPCAARGINGNWYRSLLKQDLVTSDGAVEVLHVDHGKTEFVPIGDVKPLHEKFLRMPVVTYLCSLAGVKEKDNGWTVEEVDYLKSVLLDQVVVAKFEHHNTSEDIYYVSLYADDAACINTHFIEKTGSSTNLNTHQDSYVQNDDPIPSAFLKSVGDEPGIDFCNKDNLNVATLEDNMLLCSMNEQANARTDDVGSGATPVKEKHPDPPTQNGHFPPSPPSVTQNILNEHVFPIGSAVNVKISCIESLGKFWCQTADDSEALGRLMQDMQAHYASSPTQPPVESICVARHLDNGMWYRAKIISKDLTPLVDVRFIDYGETQRVPIQDLRPIDPGFLQLNAQAFQCCLYNLTCPANPTAVTWRDGALVEFQKFVSLSDTVSSNVGLTCIVKAVTSDPQGLLLNVVDIETPFQSACKLLAQNCTQSEAPMQVPPPPPVRSDAYNYSTQNIEVGGKEKVWVTRSESINHFYCQLDRNSHLYNQVKEDIKQLISQPQCTDHSLGLNIPCLARHTKNQWYRGEIVAESPNSNLQVRFVDYGHTLVVNKSDIRPFPTEASTVRSVPVQAIPLGLLGVPADVPTKVNNWFADNVIGQDFTISVVEKDETGKLIVELYEGELNVNVRVREKIATVKQRNKSVSDQQTDRQLSDSSKQSELSVPRERCQTREHMDISPLSKMTENQVHSGSGLWAEAEEKIIVPSTPHISVPEGELGKMTSDESRKQISSSARIIDLPPRLIKQGLSAEVCISHFNNPSSFFIQLQKDKNDMFALQEKLKAFCDIPVDFNDLQVGDLVNAEFPDDGSWYRAVVRHKFEDSIVYVEFIDFGNEATIPCVKTSYLDKAFDACPRFSIPCTLGQLSNKNDQEAISILKRATAENPEKTFMCTFVKETENVWDVILKDDVLAETLVQNGQTESNVTQPNCSDRNVNICCYKKPDIAQNQTEDVFASSIIEPHYFWCQYANPEDLDDVSRLAQEVGRTEQDMTFTETLGPGSPCLALFASDEQWYRAQVIRKTGNILSVLFIDYGNESEVDIKDVRSVPHTLLERTPQAFLCSLDGFDDSKGTWDDGAFDYFHDLLVNKPLSVTVYNIKDNAEIAVPQYAVQMECGNMIVNKMMEKYWKGLATEHVMAESPESETVQGDQTKSNVTQPNCSERNVNICCYKKPDIAQNQTEDVFASSIIEPHYFWCQYANPEDLDDVSRLAQEVGHTEQDMTFTETLGPGSPCLALFASDGQWYRAQVIRKTGNILSVLFIDYGNESEVDIKDVRSVPHTLLERTPQAFLCSLDGFDDSKGTWDDGAFDYFHDLLVNKPLSLTVYNIKDNAEIAVPQYAVQMECGNMIVNKMMEKYWKGLATEHVMAESPESETVQGDQTKSNVTQPNCFERNVNICSYKKPDIAQNQTEDVFASSIVEPHYFWCQYANPEDLDDVSRLAQEVGRTEQDMTFTETLGPGSPCLALFASDEQWYRAQVIRKTGNILSVLFIDYGNESEVDIKDVRSVPHTLLERTPQAFLCSLDGFDDSKGTWDDGAFDYFYDLLVNKPLSVTVYNMEDNTEIAVPQYAVQMECGNMIVNKMMEKYWKGLATEHVMAESPESETVQGDQTKSNVTQPNCSERNVNICSYKKPDIAQNQTEDVYASSIVEPHYFWCQYANTEDLDDVSRLAQEVGHTEQDMTFTETLGPGSPCLALFASDEQWYRAQVIRKTGNILSVLFIDYGNESEVDIKDVRSVPHTLLERTPQAFLCSLDGFDDSKGTWDDSAFDYFYDLLVNKPLSVTVYNMEENPEIAVPQYAVKIECGNMVVNKVMEKYWKGSATEDAAVGRPETG
ncbi:tudor domain-containing 6 [Diretmus argenteus]